MHVIEVSIPNLSDALGISKSDERIISGVIQDFLSPKSPPTVPYPISQHTYNDKQSLYANSQNSYGNQAVYSQSQHSQPPGYQQQQPLYDYNNYNYKQQQYQRDVEIYEQKL